MSAIEKRILERGYQTPGRARAAISMSHQVKGKDKARLLGLVDAWEAEGLAGAVVGGLPEAEPTPSEGSVRNGKLAPSNGIIIRSGSNLQASMTINLNARIRARLTPYGVSVLYAARDQVTVPADLLEQRGVWETELWQFMAVMATAAVGDAPVTENWCIELLSTGA